MKSAMNWGFWIVVSFIVFAIGTFVMVYISMSSRVDLVTDDYYEKELQYQDHIELVKSTAALNKNVELRYSDSTVNITFPRIGKPEKISGIIYFFRPSDQREDVIRPIGIDSLHSQAFPLTMFSKGLWRIKISWSADEIQYYSEFPMMVQ